MAQDPDYIVPDTFTIPKECFFKTSGFGGDIEEVTSRVDELTDEVFFSSDIFDDSMIIQRVKAC